MSALEKNKIPPGYPSHEVCCSLTLNKICILYGFPCEMDFSHHESPNRVGFGDEWWEIHLTWKSIPNAFSRILYTSKHANTLRNVDHEWKPREMDLSHNCSLHGGKSEVCEKNASSVNKIRHLCLQVSPQPISCPRRLYAQTWDAPRSFPVHWHQSHECQGQRRSERQLYQ